MGYSLPTSTGERWISEASTVPNETWTSYSQTFIRWLTGPTLLLPCGKCSNIESLTVASFFGLSHKGKVYQAQRPLAAWRKSYLSILSWRHGCNSWIALGGFSELVARLMMLSFDDFRKVVCYNVSGQSFLFRVFLVSQSSDLSCTAR